MHLQGLKPTASLDRCQQFIESSSVWKGFFPICLLRIFRVASEFLACPLYKRKMIEALEKSKDHKYSFSSAGSFYKHQCLLWDSVSIHCQWDLSCTGRGLLWKVVVSRKMTKQSNKPVADLKSSTVKEQQEEWGLFVVGEKREHCRMSIKL